VREERYAMDQWRADAASGKLRECFACGTAAVVAAIGRIKSAQGDFAIGDGNGGPITAALKGELSAFSAARSQTRRLGPQGPLG